MAEYKSVVFDMDGTILNTLNDLMDSVNYVMKLYNYPVHTYEEVRSFVGNGIKNLIIRSLPEGTDDETVEKVYSSFVEYYGVHCMDKTKPYDGIVELMEDLKKKGYTMAIVSNKNDDAVKDLNKNFFGDNITAAVGARDDMKKKPAPDLVFEAVKQLGVEIKDCIFIGDSDVDLMTAKNSNMDCVAVSWGFRDRDFLIENGAEIIIDKPCELLDLV